MSGGLEPVGAYGDDVDASALEAGGGQGVGCRAVPPVRRSARALATSGGASFRDGRPTL
ncbi:hypothetical protein [Streptomyces sp. NPDC059247]|uniref:hypothetical protein n=1 Tax=Streptomyces sp. NPDC059247 TaxID=3346790 RepID=UPI0036887A95